MTERYFTPGEVEALIPRLTEVMGAVMAAHAEATAARARLQAERRRVEMAGGATIDREGWRRDTERVERGTQAIQSGLAEITRLGGAPKDLSLGLVDFPHRRQGRTVNLCWKHGEQAVRYWHELDEGFSGRQPL